MLSDSHVLTAEYTLSRLTGISLLGKDDCTLETQAEHGSSLTESPKLERRSAGFDHKGVSCPRSTSGLVFNKPFLELP